MPHVFRGMANESAVPRKSVCPGCHLVLPRDGRVVCSIYFHCSDECWGVFGEVQAYQFTCPTVFAQAHQRTVDAYAVQHAGGPHPAKSVAVHLAALHAALDRKLPQPFVQRMMQRLANSATAWPLLEPPRSCGRMTIFDVALADSSDEHLHRVETWSRLVWEAWQPHHDTVRQLAAPFLKV